MIEGVNKNIDSASFGNGIGTSIEKVTSDSTKEDGTSKVSATGNTGSESTTDTDTAVKKSNLFQPAESKNVNQQIENLADRPREMLEELPGNTLEEIKISFDDHIVDARNRTLQFSKDEETGKTIIRVIDTKTEEVIRQIPPEEFLKMVKRLNDVAQEIFKRIPKFI